MNVEDDSDFIPEGMVILGGYLRGINPERRCICKDCENIEDFFGQEIAEIRSLPLEKVYTLTSEKKDRIIMTSHVYAQLSHVIALHIEDLIAQKQYDSLQYVLQVLMAYKVPNASLVVTG
jgi:hypothetical protein